MEDLSSQLASKLTLLNEDQKKVLEDLQGLQEQHNVIEREFLAELSQLKKKYRAKYEPLYDQRCEHLTSSSSSKMDPASATMIPYFWLTAMKNHQMLSDMIEAVDEYVSVLVNLLNCFCFFRSDYVVHSKTLFKCPDCLCKFRDFVNREEVY